MTAARIGRRHDSRVCRYPMEAAPIRRCHGIPVLKPRPPQGPDTSPALLSSLPRRRGGGGGTSGQGVAQRSRGATGSGDLKPPIRHPGGHTLPPPLRRPRRLIAISPRVFPQGPAPRRRPRSPRVRARGPERETAGDHRRCLGCPRWKEAGEIPPMPLRGSGKALGELPPGTDPSGCATAPNRWKRRRGGMPNAAGPTMTPEGRAWPPGPQLGARPVAGRTGGARA